MDWREFDKTYVRKIDYRPRDQPSNEVIKTPYGVVDRRTVLTPSGRNVPIQLYQGDGLPAGYKLTTGLYGGLELYKPGGQRSYWENPQRVARYHDYIRSQPPEWKPPDWLDVPTIETAYRWFEYRNEGKPWHQWKYLPAENDEVTDWLRKLPTPPPEFLFPAEIAEIERQRKEAEAVKIGSWKNLDPYQQAWQSWMTPQPVTGDDPTGRPTSSKTWANIVRSGMIGVGGKFILSKAATAAAAAIAATGGAAAITVAAIATVGGLTMFGVSLYQLMTANKVPVIGGAVEIPGKIINVFGEGSERLIFTTAQAIHEDKDLEAVMQELPELWKTAQMGYETTPGTPLGNLLMDAYVKANIALGAEGAAAEDLARTGELYRWDLGMQRPQQAGVYGLDSLAELRERAVAGEDWNTLINEYYQKFGSQGILNDLIGQTLIDPVNLAPTMSQGVMHKLGELKGDARMMAAWPKPTLGNAVVDAMPFPMNAIAPLVTRGKLQGSAGLIAGLDKYKIFIQTGMMPGVKGVPADYKPPADFSNFEKMMGELDESGLAKWFMPDEPGKGVGGLVKWLGRLTPESKARVSQANLMDQFQRMMDNARNDPVEMTRITKVLSQADPKLTGDEVAAILNPPGEVPFEIDSRFFNSAYGTALAMALRSVVESGKVDELFIGKWDATTNARAKLWEISEMMEIKPGELLARLEKGMDIATILKNKANDKGIQGYGEITNQQLKDLLGVFTGKDAQPWHPDLYRLKLTELIHDSTEDFLIKRFDIQPDPKWLRISHAMKSVQSLLLLGLNPQYLINNAINNVITRAATGVLGFMTPKQITDLMTRMGIDPARPDAGLNKDWSIAAREYGIKADGRADKISKIKSGEKDLINSAEQLTGKVKDAVGIFGKYAGALERSESRQAYTIALRQAHGSLWQPGYGFRQMSPALDMQLDQIDPAIKQQLYDAVKHSFNADELVENIYNPAMIKIEPLIDRLAEIMASKHETINQNPDMYKQLLNNYGIADELNAGLSKAKNSADVDAVFAKAINKSGEHVRKWLTKELATRAEDIKNRVATGGVDEAIAIFTEMNSAYREEWIKHFIEIDELQRSAPSMTPKQRNDAWRSQDAIDDMRFNDLNDWYNASYKGIFNTLGKSNDPAALEFLELYKSVQGEWRDFYGFKRNKYSPLFDPKYQTDDWQTDFAKASEEVRLRAAEAQIYENARLTRADELYAGIIESVGGDGYRAEITRSSIRIIRDEMMLLMNNFRQSLIDDPPIDKADRLARWNKFIFEEYTPKIRDLHLVERVGAQQLSDVPTPTFEARAHSEITHDQIIPMLDALRDMYKLEFETSKPLKVGDLPEHIKAEIDEWVKGVKVDMPAAKLASMKYAEAARDYALLNYQKQTGFDAVLSVYAPYQFWFTRTMINWAIRMMDRPALFAIYNRYEKMRERMEKAGIPQRMRDRMRFPAAYLPDWMGGGLWVDPMKQIFPWTQFEQGLGRVANMEQSVRYKTYAVLDELVKSGEITKAQADVAKQTQEGAEWEQAYAAALKDSDLSDPMNLASMMVQPALYWSIPYQLLRGTPEKISPLPFQRYTQNIETALKDTPLELLGRGVGLLGSGGRRLRETVMTPAKAAFGEFGDYYIDRQLANMVADGVVSIRDANAAMIEREGAVYEQALERVKQEVALKSPGILPVMALKGGANIPQLASSIFLTMFPAGILPAGELEYIGKRPEYSAAWERAKLGDGKALAEFFDNNPEFEARIALRDEPEERLRQFLISEIWDRYHALSTRNKTEAKNQLGQDFDDNFLSKTTRNYESLPVETLAAWAHLLGGYTPKVEQTRGVEQIDYQLDLWPEDVAQAYQKYQDERNQLFPAFWLAQNKYFDLPRNQRQGFLKKFPELAQYWQWKRDYAAKNPIITPVLAANNLEAQMESETRGIVDVNNMDSILQNQIQYSAMTGLNLTPGAWMALEYQWRKLGEPYGDLDKWVKEEVLTQFK